MSASVGMLQTIVHGRDIASSPGRDTMVSVILRGLRVLVVDDNEDNRDLIVLLLEERGACCDAAESVHDALAKLASAQFDVVITDIAMPREDGLSLVRKLKANPRTSGVRAIAITGYVQEADRDIALAAGFDAFIPKPFHVDQVTAALQR